MGECVLQVRNLHKMIGGRELIRDISFDVKAGEVFGFLGPNGAGKTTTIRMITGMIKPTQGTIQIMGYCVQKQFEQAMMHLGAIVEQPALFKYLSGWQNLKQAARISGVPVTDEHMKWCVQTVELTDRIHDQVGTYSLGMKQRLGIAQALLASPKILVLDEPTNGMDPSGIKEMRMLIRKLADEQKLSIFISSHLLNEVEQLCDRVVIINHGKSIVSGVVEELAGKNEHSAFALTVDEDLLEQGKSILSAAGVEVLEQARELVVSCDQKEIPHLVNQLYQKGIGVYLIKKAHVSLEDYFLEITKEGEK